MAHHGLAIQLSLACLQIAGLEEKMNLLYLLDSVYQSSCKKNMPAIRTFVANDGMWLTPGGCQFRVTLNYATGRLRSVFMRVFVEGERTRRADEIFVLVEKACEGGERSRAAGPGANQHPRLWVGRY